MTMGQVSFEIGVHCFNFPCKTCRTSNSINIGHKFLAHHKAKIIYLETYTNRARNSLALAQISKVAKCLLTFLFLRNWPDAVLISQVLLVLVRYDIIFFFKLRWQQIGMSDSFRYTHRCTYGILMMKSFITANVADYNQRINGASVLCGCVHIVFSAATRIMRISFAVPDFRNDALHHQNV